MDVTRQSGRSVRGVVWFLALVGLIAGAVVTFRAGAPPEIVVEPGLPGIGKSTPVRVEVREPGRGLSDIRVEVEQSGQVQMLDSRHHTPREPWRYWGDRVEADELSVVVGRDHVEFLQEGPAVIRVVAGRAGTWLRGPDPVVHEETMQVILKPPTVGVLSSSTYVSQGGCEAVVYRVGESAVADGVQAGDWWFPGIPFPGGPEGKRLVLFGAPYDLDDGDRIRLVARDAVGNESRVRFIDRFTPRPMTSDTIRLSDAFLTRVVPLIMDQTPELKSRGTPMENYLAINNELRADNASTLVELAERSRPEFLWSESFLQMRNAKVMSSFADRRTYLYNGVSVDRQDHLGYDLASTRAAEIEAANDGVVVLSRYFGIYGNAVVIDHGHGLMSLYGHLSSLAVAEGQTVKRGEMIGRSGATGLAGGDHLHFTMLLRGLAVDPREWWDAHWIQDRLVLKLGPALPFTNR